MLTIRDIQRRLMLMGYNPGPIDGERGRLTMRAVKAFQRNNGLVADGIVGPKTTSALFGSATAIDTMPWYEEAKKLKGTREVRGRESNPVILDWAEGLDLDYAGDDTPWCGLFVAHCIAATMTEEPIPNNPLGARMWKRFGESVTPQEGSILVFWRGSIQGWQGHVGFYHGEDKDCYYVLGGNQSNMVNIARVSKSRLLDARWPVTGFPPAGSRVGMSLDLKVSENEA